MYVNSTAQYTVKLKLLLSTQLRVILPQYVMLIVLRSCQILLQLQQTYLIQY